MGNVRHIRKWRRKYPNYISSELYTNFIKRLLLLLRNSEGHVIHNKYLAIMRRFNKITK